MSLPRYPEYKDSGVAWLGEVPGHWMVHRARAIGTFTASGIDKKFVEGEQPVKMFNYVDVYKSSDKKLRYSEDLMDTTAPREKALEHAVREGDLLLTPSSETSDDIGHAAQVLNVPEGVVYSYHILRFRPGPSVDSTFLTYAFNSSTIRSYFSSVCTGTTRMVLVRDDFRNTALPLPSFKEQQAIATFLDRETGKIDALIAEQRRLVELLAEKRQAVISHAVTKGLPSTGSGLNARMKDSGIAWLGDVPEHWVVKRVRFVAELNPSKSEVAALDKEMLVSFLPMDAIGDDGTLNLEREKPIAEVETGYTYFRDGDVTIAKITPCFENGKGAVMRGLTQGIGFGTTELIVARPFIGQANSEYLHFIFISDVFRKNGEGHMYGAGGQKRVPDDFLRNFEIAFPPIEEQHTIAAYLATETAKFDTLTAEANRAIELLQERRSALISAAVTGKIDVRGIQTLPQ